MRYFGRKAIDDWDAGLYDGFADERQRAAIDLLRAIKDHTIETATDLGCGSGLSTELITRRWPHAHITALDSSPAMLAKAAARVPNARLLEMNIEDFVVPEPQQLIFANASLHWVADHQTLLPYLLEQLTRGGVLAIQMPDNLAEPSHRLMEETAQEADFANCMERSVQPRPALLDSSSYYDLLAPHCSEVQIWVTRYAHVLESADAIANWFSSTGLRPYLDALPATHRDLYLERYREALRRAYEPRIDGNVLLYMPRLFIVARRA